MSNDDRLMNLPVITYVDLSDVTPTGEGEYVFQVSGGAESHLRCPTSVFNRFISEYFARRPSETCLPVSVKSSPSLRNQLELTLSLERKRTAHSA